MGKKINNKLVSIIIPAYKQEKTIEEDLLHIKSILDQLRSDYEMIVVVDGMLDRTYENANRVKSPKIHIVGYEKNRGKGFAVRFGMIRAKGDIIGFIDSGMDLDPNGISLVLENLEWADADIIIGSKRHPVSKVHYPLARRTVSFLAQMLIGVLFGLRVKDTQVGMKFFRRDVIRAVLPRLLVKKFAFDIEILAVANRLGYSKIYEAPVEITYNFSSSISQGLLRVLF